MVYHITKETICQRRFGAGGAGGARGAGGAGGAGQSPEPAWRPFACGSVCVCVRGCVWVCVCVLGVVMFCWNLETFTWHVGNEPFTLQFTQRHTPFVRNQIWIFSVSARVAIYV